MWDSSPTRSDTPRPPWWARGNPVIGRAPALTARQWHVLGLVIAAAVFNQYDRALLVLALPQIQAGLGISESELGVLGSWVRLGALPAVFVAAWADRVGRRRVLLGTILAYTLLTGLTAAAPNVWVFGIAQFLAHGCLAAEMLLSIVVVTEELGPRHRGWGVGALLALQGAGAGLAALLLPLAASSPEGWRGLFLVGLGPLALLAWWRRRMPETERFEKVREAGLEPEAGILLGSFLRLASGHRARLAAVLAAVFAVAAGSSAADFLSVKFLQSEHGWSASGLSALYLVGGAAAICGGPLAGRLSDRHGRRGSTVGFSVALVLVAWCFFGGQGLALAPLWALLVFVNLGTDVLLATYGAELFPTRLRATALGVRMLVATLGGALGLALESVVYGWTGSHSGAVMLLAGLVLVAPLVILGFLPETAGRSLEDIAPDRDPTSPAPDLVRRTT